MKTDDNLRASLSGCGKVEKRRTLDLEEIKYILKRFSDVEEFLGQKLAQLRCYRL